MFEALVAFFVISSIWWWIGTIAFLIFIIWGGISEKGWMLGINFIGYILVLQFLVHIPVWQTIYRNPLWVILAFIAYFVSGVGWSMFKWNLRVQDFAALMRGYKAEFYKNKKFADDYKLTSDEKKEFEKKYEWQYRPKFIESKSDIGYWITYWPISLLMFFLDDVIKRLVDWLVNKFRSVYQGIENKAYKEI